MAEIVHMAERRGRGPAPPRAGMPCKAKILFFTGVRYERLDDGGPAAKSPVAKKGRSTRAGKR